MALNKCVLLLLVYINTTNQQQGTKILCYENDEHLYLYVTEIVKTIVTCTV